MSIRINEYGDAGENAGRTLADTLGEPVMVIEGLGETGCRNCNAASLSAVARRSAARRAWDRGAPPAETGREAKAAAIAAAASVAEANAAFKALRRNPNGPDAVRYARRALVAGVAGQRLRLVAALKSREAAYRQAGQNELADRAARDAKAVAAVRAPIAVPEALRGRSTNAIVASQWQPFGFAESLVGSVRAAVNQAGAGVAAAAVNVGASQAGVAQARADTFGIRLKIAAAQAKSRVQVTSSPATMVAVRPGPQAPQRGVVSPPARAIVPSQATPSPTPITAPEAASGIMRAFKFAAVAGVAYGGYRYFRR